MKNYRVIVNGTEYEVAIEEIAANEAAKPAAPAPAPAASAPAGGKEVKAPMPGTVLSVAVKSGDSVKEGQTLLVLEAMKMENEIVAPCAGTVKALNAAKGAAVESGAVLAVIG